MSLKFNPQLEIESKGNSTARGLDVSSQKIRNALDGQRKLLKKRLFGDHYNHTRVDLNKEKKYLLQEQRNTEIERTNLILLQKIQSISKRSAPLDTLRRVSTQEEQQIDHGEVRTRPIKSRINRIRLQNKTRESQDESAQQSFNQRMSSKMIKKHAFKGNTEIAGRNVDVRTNFEDKQCIIILQTDDFCQKIKMSRECYLQILNNLMDKKHSNIVNLLSFNGRQFQLADVPQASMEIQIQTQIKLPCIDHKLTSKHKTQGSIEYESIS